MTVHVQVFVWMYIFNLLVYVYPGVRFLDHVVHRCLKSEGLLRPFSKSAVSILCFIILYCTSTYEDLRVWISSHFCQHQIFSIIFIMAILSCDENKSICFLLLCLCSMWNWLICMAWYKYDFFKYWDLIALEFSYSILSLRSHGLQHAKLPCPSPSPRDWSNSCLLNWWCHPNILFSDCSCLQSFLTSGSFPMSQPFASGGQSIGASASASVLPMNI